MNGKTNARKLCEARWFVFLCLQTGGDFVTKDGITQCRGTRTKMSGSNLFGFRFGNDRSLGPFLGKEYCF